MTANNDEQEVDTLENLKDLAHGRPLACAADYKMSIKISI